MAYTLTRALSLGADNAGKTLRAQLVDTAGANVGSPITTGFAARGPAGSYRWQGSLPDGFQGWIEIADTGTGSVLAVLPVNPRESEYADLKTSSRLAASTPLAELAYGPPANPTVEQAMMLLYMALRNRMETTAS
ncbi:MAG TPA: hypothetical protein VK689_06220, partial [Armatimonadota bacterium]|nr:hypothetical protein [Armatimonadota bacterium]